MKDRFRLLQESKDSALCWSCGFAESREHPTCLVEATWHGFVLDDPAKRIVAMMASCDEHKAAMALSADFVHPMASACAVPGSWFLWPENYCYIPGADQEFAALADLEVPV